MIDVGVAKIDITPDYPIRLSGYGMRRTESEGVDQRIWAKALAMGSDAAGVSLLLTVDNVGVPGHITEAVYEKVAAQFPVRRENFALASSHTHTAPMLRGTLPFLFSQDIPVEHQERVDRYTATMVRKLAEVALRALGDLRPAFVGWGEGRAGFALNRRNPAGPVDHAVPVLAARSPEGKVRAILANYACHCTTLNHNRIHGDWAGHAQKFIEEDHPGSIALISIGAGADANPEPRRELALARRHGREIADEVARLLKTSMTPITAVPQGRIKSIELPFDALPTREEFEQKSTEEGIVGYHARKYLDRLDRGEELPTTLPYQVQAWHFGDQLAMIFLPGEVVADYALRLKEDFDRIWVTAYANDVPCYIPSERVLERGHAEYSYEAIDSMRYYGQPTRFAQGVEQRIIDAMHATVPEAFLGARKGTRNAPVAAPLSPASSGLENRVGRIRVENPRSGRD